MLGVYSIPVKICHKHRSNTVLRPDQDMFKYFNYFKEKKWKGKPESCDTGGENKR